MPEALSSAMIGAMDWANRSAFRLFVAAPWPPRFRKGACLLPSPLALHAEGRIDEQQHTCRRHQPPQQIAPPTYRPRPFDMSHGASPSQPTLGG
jgi:hypothetical protein